MLTVGMSVILCGVYYVFCIFFFQAEDGIRDRNVTGVQTCALPICRFPYPINEVFFIDKQTGWLGAYKGAVYRTMDGGATWLEQTTGLEPRPGNSENISKLFSIYGIHFIDPLNGWAAARAEEEEGGRLIATTDGGNSWKPLMTTDQEKLRSVFFVNRNEGWVTSNSGRYIYHTSDAGKTWTAEQIVFEQNSPIYRIAGSDAAHMWAVGGGAIFARINQ